MFCKIHPNQKMTALFTSSVCDICDPPGGKTTPVTELKLTTLQSVKDYEESTPVRTEFCSLKEVMSVQPMSIPHLKIFDSDYRYDSVYSRVKATLDKAIASGTKIPWTAKISDHIWKNVSLCDPVDVTSQANYDKLEKMLLDSICKHQPPRFSVEPWMYAWKVGSDE